MYIQPYKPDHQHQKVRAFIKSLLTTEDQKLNAQKQALIRTKCAAKGYHDLDFIIANLSVVESPVDPEYLHHYLFYHTANPVYIVSIGQAKIPCIYNPVTKLTCTFNIFNL